MIALVRFVDQLLRRLDAEAMVVQVHVGKPGDGAGLDDGEARGDKRVARHDDLVAGADAQRVQGDVQRGGAGGDADGVAAALPLGELLLELHAPLAGPVVHFAGAQDGLDRFDRILVELRPALQFVGDGLGAAVNRQLVAHIKVLSFFQLSSGCPKRFGVPANSARTHLSHPDAAKSSRAKFECRWAGTFCRKARLGADARGQGQ